MNEEKNITIEDFYRKEIDKLMEEADERVLRLVKIHLEALLGKR